MSIIKYTKKYLIYSLLALLVICGVGALVYNQIQKELAPHKDTFGIESAEASEPFVDPPRQNMWQKITSKLKKKPKASHSHDHDHHHIGDSSDEDVSLPRGLEKRLDKVRIAHRDPYTSDYPNSPGYFQDVYDAVSNGRDMAATIKDLKKYGIYTDVVLEHMDSYEAFKYIINTSIAIDFKQGKAIEYAQRVTREAPRSAEALEAWFYLKRVTKDPQEEEAYLRSALEYHPQSIGALNGLGSLLALDRPDEAIPYLKKANGLDAKVGNRDLGFAYQRLGDYKTAWVHLKKDHALRPDSPYSLWHLQAIERGEPGLSPVERAPLHESTEQGASIPQTTPSEETAIPLPEVFVDGLVIPAEVPASVQVPERPSPEELARQDAEQQAFLEMLREQDEFTRRLVEDEQFRLDYFREVDAFIEWAESIENDAPIETNNFLAKEMERHLLGKKTTFEPDRIKRGFDFIQKYGQEDGIKRLQQLDPDLAKEMTHLLNEKRGSRPRNQSDQ